MEDAQPLSYEVKVTHIAANPVNVTLNANVDECRALAQFWNVLAVKSLSAHVRLSRWKRDGVKVAGTINAILEQECVISLNPVETSIDETFESHFVPENSRLARPDRQADQELVIDIESPDGPETFSGHMIDIGSVVAEFAAMNIDPYPKHADAKMDEKYLPDDNALDDKPKSPFAALEQIRSKLDKND